MVENLDHRVAAYLRLGPPALTAWAFPPASAHPGAQV